MLADILAILLVLVLIFGIYGEKFQLGSYDPGTFGYHGSFVRDV